MKLLALLKAKLVVTVLAGVVLAGGATAVMAATPTGQHLFQAINHSVAQGTKTPEATQQGQQGQANTCPGLADAQHLATQFALSSDTQSSAVQAICALHTGAFKGTTPGGSTSSSNRVFGYGEINQLLIYARYLATHDKANATSQPTTGNVESYLAEALQSCGKSPLEQCLKTNIPNYQPGTSNGNGGGNGPPAGTPTPHGGKPTGTTTPHA